MVTNRTTRPAPAPRLTRNPTLLLTTTLLLLVLAAGPVAAQAPTGPDSPFAAFEPLIGEWGPDPESEFVRSAPAERREALGSMVGLAFEWGPNRQAILVREVYPNGSPELAEGYGVALWNPVTQQHHFAAANTTRGFFFDGFFRILEGGAVQRVYEVFYGADREQIPGDSEPGWTRRFRDTYTLDADGLEQRVEIFWQGAWRPWGAGTYRLVRRD